MPVYFFLNEYIEQHACVSGVEEFQTRDQFRYLIDDTVSILMSVRRSITREGSGVGRVPEGPMVMEARHVSSGTVEW